MSLKKISIKITGMHCTACALNLDLELEEIKGVKSAKTNFAKSVTEITYDPETLEPKELIKAVEKCGFKSRID